LCHQLKRVILVPRLHRFTGTPHTFGPGNMCLVCKAHHSLAAFGKLSDQLIDHITHSAQLLILPLELTLQLATETVLNLPYKRRSLYLSTGLRS
jgi:hypothetical protein